MIREAATRIRSAAPAVTFAALLMGGVVSFGTSLGRAFEEGGVGDCPFVDQSPLEEAVFAAGTVAGATTTSRRDDLDQYSAEASSYIATIVRSTVCVP